jgi:hydrogenase maturation protease
VNKTLLIGVGNEFRSDDALGILVAREIRRRHAGEIHVLEFEGHGASLLDAWEGVENLLIVDAVDAPAPPGSILRFDVSQSKLPAHLFQESSHAFGVAEALELARELRRLPPTVFFYGIVGESFETGQGLSDRVLKNIPDLLQMIEEDVHTFELH